MIPGAARAASCANRLSSTRVVLLEGEEPFVPRHLLERLVLPRLATSMPGAGSPLASVLQVRPSAAALLYLRAELVVIACARALSEYGDRLPVDMAAKQRRAALDHVHEPAELEKPTRKSAAELPTSTVASKRRRFLRIISG
jgi:hypothetical protein